jgi:hypothetical protein
MERLRKPRKTSKELIFGQIFNPEVSCMTIDSVLLKYFYVLDGFLSLLAHIEVYIMQDAYLFK